MYNNVSGYVDGDLEREPILLHEMPCQVVRSIQFVGRMACCNFGFHEVEPELA